MERKNRSGKFSKLCEDEVFLRKTGEEGSCCGRGIGRKTRSTEETSGVFSDRSVLSVSVLFPPAIQWFGC